MQTATWLRIAAGLTAFQTVGHTVGAVLPGPANAEESALRETMRGFRVSLMGMERSYWDFYHGSGWAITALAATVATVMWLLAPIARESPRAARPMILALAVGYAAITAISALYFVTAPIVIGAMITGCLVMAAMVARPSAAAVTLLFAVALFPGALSAQAGAPTPRPTNRAELEAYVTRFTGANPLDCGQHAVDDALPPPPAEDLQTSVACAYDAAKAQNGFWTFTQEPGMDSMLFQGLLGTTEGTIYQFSYDSAPCGGPGCGGRFSVSRCNYPTLLVHRSKRTHFGCDDVKRLNPDR